MADYHILSGDEYGNGLQVVFHISVPDQTNEVGYGYRAAIVEYQSSAGDIVSAVPFIDAAELAQLQTGELFEVLRTFHSNPIQTLAQKRDALDAMFAAVKTEVQTDLGDILGYWGYSRNVP